ncbi:DUF1028 domain-containing protein [Williamsia sp.]|uniref:DUF1028 domain-containing protein n=1 Tax=Williamsia sp. TaxID=1872085 RepID=UPI002F938C1B
MTYSIVARDPVTGSFGTACQSHFFAPGASVTWARAGYGAVATQAFVRGGYGGAGTARLGDETAPLVLREMLAADRHPEVRQVLMVGADGIAAAHTGSSCIESCGDIVDGDVAVAGNMLANNDVLPAMIEGYRSSRLPFADRLLAAMVAAEEAGGDARGSQGASLLVVDGTVDDDPWDHKPIDLRVEDHPDPICELTRLLTLRRSFDAVSAAMFAPGLMVGDFREPAAGDLDRALDALLSAADVLAPNPEPLFWRAMLLLRSGRTDDARAGFAALFDENPHLRQFSERVAAAGFVDAATMKAVL